MSVLQTLYDYFRADKSPHNWMLVDDDTLVVSELETSHGLFTVTVSDTEHGVVVTLLELRQHRVTDLPLLAELVTRLNWERGTETFMIDLVYGYLGMRTQMRMPNVDSPVMIFRKELESCINRCTELLYLSRPAVESVICGRSRPFQATIEAQKVFKKMDEKILPCDSTDSGGSHSAGWFTPRSQEGFALN